MLVLSLAALAALPNILSSVSRTASFSFPPPSFSFSSSSFFALVGPSTPLPRVAGMAPAPPCCSSSPGVSNLASPAFFSSGGGWGGTAPADGGVMVAAGTVGMAASSPPPPSAGVLPLLPMMMPFGGRVCL